MKPFFSMIMCMLIYTGALSQTAKNFISGSLTRFNDDGAWCWYQDERAVVDTVNGKIIVGSVANAGTINAVVYDIETNTSHEYELANLGTDDHNAPAFIVRPDGKYLAMYAAHYDQWNSRYRIFDGTTWSPEQVFDWTTIPGGTDYTIAYSNLYYLSAEGRMYNFARANERAPNFIISTDIGDTWSFGGQLVTNASNTYNKGYFKYWGNGVDRIDFIFTEQHPRDTSTSIYHGYIMNGKSFASDGTVADDDIFDRTFIPTFKNFTKVFADSTVYNGDVMRRCWNIDVQRYADGTIATLISCRANDNTQGNDFSINPDHRFFYCRYDGSEWTYTYLGKAGPKMYDSEADYTGLGALCPDNPNTIYISTTFDPRDNTDLIFHEIFKGVTTDHGVTWTWTPVTRNSEYDNYRPIVPAWNANNNVLLWWRGTYFAAQAYDAEVVGIINQSPVNTLYDDDYPSGFNLSQNSPNPFNLTTEINYSLEKPSQVKIVVYDLQGRTVRTLENSYKTAGEYSILWDASDNRGHKVAAGIYYYSLEAGNLTMQKKMILLK